jgi:hypothetical protein
MLSPPRGSLQAVLDARPWRRTGRAERKIMPKEGSALAKAEEAADQMLKKAKNIKLTTKRSLTLPERRAKPHSFDGNNGSLRCSPAPPREQVQKEEVDGAEDEAEREASQQQQPQREQHHQTSNAAFPACRRAPLLAPSKEEPSSQASQEEGTEEDASSPLPREAAAEAAAGSDSRTATAFSGPPEIDNRRIKVTNYMDGHMAGT